MKTWSDYKKHVKDSDMEARAALEEAEEQAAIISAIIQQRKDLGLSQRDLAAICGIPQSSVARIESFQTVPKLSTVLKIMKPLGLKMTITK